MREFRLTGLDRDDPRYREAIAAAAEALGRGLLVAFPTETVYGLGASIAWGEAVHAIYRVKGRPRDNPLIVHVGDAAAARRLCRCWPEAAERAAAAFWPGPLTLILPRTDDVPDAVTAGLDTVAIRVPAQRVALDLVREAGPVAAPSANRSGRPSPTRAEHVRADLGDAVAVLLDDGPCPVGVESTVVDLSGDRAIVLRPGGVPIEALREVLGDVSDAIGMEGTGGASDGRAAACQPRQQEPPRSPGMRYRHYAPDTPLLLVVGQDPATLRRLVAERVVQLRSRGWRVGVLGADQVAAGIDADACYALGDFDRPDEAAARLFAALRELDKCGLDWIVAHTYRAQGYGVAINDRLQRAAAAVAAEGLGTSDAPPTTGCPGRDRPRRVLLVCTGNTCRSPMAEVLLRSLGQAAGLALEVRSAGLHAIEGSPAAREAVDVLAERGIELGNHRSRRLVEADVEWADLILTMTRQHKEALLRSQPRAADKVHTLAEYAGGDRDVDDPIGLGIAAYRACAADLEAYLRRIVDRWRSAP